MRFHPPSFDADEHFRRRADNRQTSHADEVHVRRRIDVPQRAIHRERIGGDVCFEPLRQDGLIDVASGNLVLDRPDTRLVGLALHVRADRGRDAVARLGLRESALEFALEKLDLGARELIQSVQVFVGRDARVGDDQDAVLHVIEGEHRVEQHEAGLVLGFWIGRAVGSPRSLGPGIEQRWFKSRRGVVADESDRATGESRQPWDERRLEFRHEPAKTLDERLVGLARDTRSIDSRSGAALPEHEERIFSQEGITGDLLASFDALEQERVIRVLGNLGVSRSAMISLTTGTNVPRRASSTNSSNVVCFTPVL